MNAGENTSLFLRFVILEADILNNTAVVDLNNGSDNITVVSIFNVGKFHPNINIESITAYPNDEVNVKINVTSEEGNYTGKLEITLLMAMFKRLILLMELVLLNGKFL